MKLLILAVLLNLPVQVAKADALELQEVIINYKSFVGEIRNPYTQVPGLEKYTLQSELNLDLNMDVFEHFYWDNRIHSLNDGQFRLVGWNYKLGLHITDYVDFGWNHFSEHYLDFTSPYGFPLQNSWELNVYIFRRHNPGKGLF